ncbi:DUF4893 domain-containing protein [Sphingomonas sp.]|uniref:DUF4893 domain-containing protein n=1 Tax=Sphingomonas sp. TaxID=28214 RepID=UPI0035C85B1D
MTIFLDITSCARRAVGIGALTALAACGTVRSRDAGLPPPPSPPAMGAPGTASGWRKVATVADRQRLRDWRRAWLSALNAARRSDATAIAEQGALFQPDLALSDPVPPPGDYRCRAFKLGNQGGGGGAMPAFVAYPWFACRVGVSADGAAQFVKLTGSQRHVGTIYASEPRRAVFLGSMMLGDDARALPYGRDRERDIAAWVERVGPRRWRMAMPYPAFESTLDVLELVPAD